MIPSGKDTRVFTGVMDTDTEARYMNGANYRYLLNARSSINSQGKFGAIDDVMGNVLVNNPDIPAGRNKVIGSCEDIAGQSCIYFAWNEFGHHGIYRWFANRVGFPNGVIETIYKVRYPNLYDPTTNPNPLSFEENKLITGVNLVGDLLYWTDYNREPKEINIVRANNTNKKLSFNFYIDATDLSVATTYSFSLFIENTLAPVYATTITSTQTILEDRIKNIAAQLNADPLFPNYLTLVNKNQYIEFTCVNTGNYYLTAFNTGTNQCIVLAENHYPDYIGGTIASPPPLTEDVLKRVKYPPFCAPEVEYETLSGDKVIQVTTGQRFNIQPSWRYSPSSNYHSGTTDSTGAATHVSSISPAISTNIFDQYFLLTPAPSNHPYNQLTGNPDGGGGFDLNLGFEWATSAQYPFEFILYTGPLPVPQTQNQIAYLGFTAEQNDYLNIITLGVPTPLIKNTGNALPLAYIKVPQPTNLFVSVNMQVSVNIHQGTNNATSFEIWLYKFDLLTSVSSRVQLIYKTTTSVIGAQIVQSFNFAAQINCRYGIATEINGITTYWSNPEELNTYFGYTNGKVVDYTVQIGALDISLGKIDLGTITTEAFLFRNKYYFNDNEQSVLSSISKLPLPNTNLSQNIVVNYDDKWLKDVQYLSTIKYIYLYVSKDNGLTWSQWQKIEKWKFAPMLNRIDYFNNKEILTTISAEEALLPYHAVPLKSKSQEYIDDRLWDGAIVEGYDNTNLHAAAFANYRNIINETAFNNTPYLSVSGFRYGYEGYIGIVYYDNADRKSGVNLVSKNKFTVPLLSSSLSGLSNILTQAIAPQVTVTLNNTPPDWATKYQVVITKDLAAVKSLVWIPARVQKVDVNFVATTSNPRYWEIDLDNIPYYIDHADLGTQISYTFQKGDRLRILAYGGGQVLTQDYDMQILAAAVNKVYVGYDAALPWEQGNATAFGLNCFVELYSGQIEATAEETTFYEIGHCYEIAFDSNNQKYHTANFQNQDYATNTPAAIKITNGGFYYRKRLSYTYIGATTNYQQTPPAMIWSGTINDFNEMDTDGFGRTNVISDIGQQYRYSTFRFSDQYQEVLNGLSANQPLNFTQLNLNYGDLNKMQVVNNDILRLVFGNSYQVSIYVNQGVIRQSQGAVPIISISDQVAGNSHIIQRTLGTINAESVYVNDEGDVFGYDENEGVVWLTQSNGLAQISDRGLKSVFKQYSNQRKATSGISEAPCIYDLYHDEYILTLGTVKGTPMIPPSLVIDNIPDLGANYQQVFFDLKLLPQPPGPWYYAANAFYPEIWKLLNSVLVNGGWGYTITHTPNPLGGPDTITITAPDYNNYVNKQLQITLGGNVYVYTFTGGQPAVNDIPGVTIAYNKQKQGWTSYYSFVPECYGRVRDYIVSFKNGELWKHDANPLAKNFYGVQYTRDFTFVCNKDFPKVKQYKAIQVNGIGQNDCPYIAVPPFEGVLTGMQSSLSKRFFQTLEGLQYAHFQKDKLSPGFGGNQLQALVNGRDLKGQTLEVTLQNDDNAKSSIFSVDIVYFYSENS